jgi:hypothetical protein
MFSQERTKSSCSPANRSLAERADQPINSATVEQVCIGRFQVRVDLSEDCSVAIETDIICQRDGRSFVVNYGNIGSNNGQLLFVIWQKITDVRKSSSEVIFYFGNGDVWNVILKNSGYESLNITSRERLIVI